MVCPACGHSMGASDGECPHCHGKSLAAADAEAGKGDGLSFLMTVLGFLVPLAGLIIYLLQRDQKPLYARSAGRGAALGFGLAVVAVSCFLLLAYFYSAFGRGHDNAQRTACHQNLRQLCLATILYTEQNNGKLPDLSSPEATRVALGKFAGGRDVFTCPLGHAYQANASLSGKDRERIQRPETTILFTEKAGAHPKGYFEAFVDGHIRWVGDE